MKTRRIWIVIMVILVAGVCSTTYTKRYVEGRENRSMRTMTEAAYDIVEEDAGPDAAIAVPQAAMPFAAETAPPETQAGKDIAASGADGQEEAQKAAAETVSFESEGAVGADGEAQTEAAGALAAMMPASAPAADATETPGIAPGAAAAENAPAPDMPGSLPQGSGMASGTPQQETMAANQSEVIVAGSGQEKLEISYKTRLEELDVQIERNRKADAEKPVANSVKARAENELKLWEAELDGILKALEGHLDSTQIEELYTRQREWRREKESAALEAAKKQSGSTLEEVEYSISLGESTRARAYELVEEYGAVLGE